ncbi:hypothetical protein GXP70_10685 [Paenibacillus lycopersici]|uniref:Uncharacterized protein n=1 Tax=Paenibacillus lycopersici TaxID=2704462 RepID=A0A6C0FY03_9BACL|nr:hypothetical protein [Paenibacillus lycopersici]QHT60361.1 hypothetical protein GXP70_10685 [Paenibacillus lycopersici]
MKRYWFSILLPVFMAAGIGTYYAGASRGLPEYRLQTVAGDAKEAGNLVFDGQTRPTSYVYNNVSIGADGTEYDRNKSMIAQIRDNDHFRNPDLSKLLNDHRGFMRGKNSYSGFYADRDRLVYALAEQGPRDAATHLSHYEISIYAQDLKTGKNKRFDAIMPGKQQYSYLNVDDIQFAGGQLKLLVTLSTKVNDLRSGSLMTEIHLLTVDLDKEGIANDEMITADAAKAAGKEEHYAVLDNDMNVASPSDYRILGKNTVLVSKDENGNWNEQMLATDYSVLDYRTGKLAPLPGDVKTDGSDELHLLGGKLMKLSVLPDHAHVQFYDLGSGADAGKYDIPMKLQGNDSVNKFVYGDRLYLFHREMEKSEVLIANANDGKVVYQGQLTVDGTAEQQKEHLKALVVFNFYLKQ